MKALEALITEAFQTLSDISNHPDFKELVNLQLWDDPSILLSDATQALKDIERIHTTYKSAQCLLPNNEK